MMNHSDDVLRQFLDGALDDLAAAVNAAMTDLPSEMATQAEHIRYLIIAANKA